ncbi:hypothetical protein HAX54_041183, partial [Datura stramonium]|nr:hypothetical protein [Datura stramonium]
EALKNGLNSRKVTSLIALLDTEKVITNNSMEVSKNNEEISIVMTKHPFTHDFEPHNILESNQTIAGMMGHDIERYINLKRKIQESLPEPRPMVADFFIMLPKPLQ